MTNNNDSKCPKCGSSIPEDAPSGLCPQCVLAGAASASTATVTSGRNTPPPTVEEIAPHFPELEIIELLGAGGMGAVYKARQPQLDREVALKILSHDLSSDPAFTERFNREAKVLARLSHPNIVGIFDFGTAGPLCYLLMEYVDGVNLRQAMQAGQFSPSESLAMVEEICSALKFAHEEGILHRDIKPENVLIDSKGRVKIADFGIAKLVGEGEQADVTLTMQGSVLGSPHYMAPEQIETPDDIDQRADIYSLGVVFYELLTGELPLGRFALPSEKASMDTRIDEIVMRTLEKERQARFQSAEEVMTQVGAVAQSQGAARSAATPPQSDDSGTVRFSLLSAILTGSSVILAIIFIWFWNTNDEHVVSAEATAASTASRMLPAIILLILAAGSAICGFFMGANALSQIRKSGGLKDGLGSSIFAVVLWPFLFMCALSFAFLSMPIPDDGGRPIGVVLAIPILGIPLIASLFLMARALARWARGVKTKDGGHRHPGLGIPLLIAFAVVFIGPILATIAYHTLPTDDRNDRVTEIEMEMAREESKFLTGSMFPEEVKWFRGAPEVIIPVEIYPGTRADFRLVRYDAAGKNPKYIEIGSMLGIQGNGPAIQSLIKIGTSGSRTENQDGERGFTGLLEFTGQSGSLSGESDFSGWEFDVERNQRLSLANPKQLSIQIATQTVDVEGGKGRAAYLKLEINVSRR